jgi:protein tyrosine/serine phosphatase
VTTPILRRGVLQRPLDLRPDTGAGQRSPGRTSSASGRRDGIKTIVNLRGGFDASFHALEKDACERLGLNFVNFTITSREVPSRDRVLGAKRLFETLEYPALMHCKSGADRAGIMSVLYMHFRKGQTIREALDQLSLKYLHIRHGKTGVLDYTFAATSPRASRPG